MDNAEFVVLLANDGDTGAKALFGRMGCRVETAPLERIIDILVDRKIDLILLDVDSVQGRAVPLVRMVRRLNRSIPIVAIATTYTLNGYDIEIDLRQAGVLACRGKPLTEEEARWLVGSARQYSRNVSSQPFRK